MPSVLAEALGGAGTALAKALTRAMTEVIWNNCIAAKVTGNKGECGEDRNQMLRLVESVRYGSDVVYGKESRGDNLCCLL